MRRTGILCAVLLCLSTACTPVMYLRQKPEIANVSGELEGRGDNTFVLVRLASKDGDSSWKVEFINETPDQLTVEKVISTTHIRWKLNPERSKALDRPIIPVPIYKLPPYEINLTSQDGQKIKLTIKFSHSGALTFIPIGIPLK